MSGAALIAGITVAIHYGLPLIEAIAPPLLQLPRANAEAVILQELDAYQGFAARKDKVGMMAARVRVVGESPTLRPAVADLLPPLWSCRTQWQCDTTVALIKSEIHRGQK